ncbi:hypothetical protein BJF96_g9819 [Verticillium dahliae]|uniref:Amino acid transporter transmembrane domain-containing protein n=1 Tax=Verticillium dahliae TaxID=27337 RepID=A0AA45AHA2_VERDA|nr:hypothetical protein BJF96_g9819 [Verticillium dahliae]PNH49372.1 hypothetical protein VD0003_g7760 [Verticillium dahliae]
MASLKEGTVGNPDQKDTSELEKLGESYAVENPGEVFDQSEYRALGWIPAAVILLTLCFATGVLAIPATFSVLGYVPGLLVLLGFGALTTYYAYIIPWEGLTIFTWIGFASLFTAVFIIVIGVTQVDRPAAAPQEGPFDIGVVTIGAPAVAPGLTAAVNIFAAFSSTPTFMPVIAEMKAPRAFKNSLFSSQIVLFICHVTMSLVVYLYCGKYVASPALGSAGGLLVKIAHGISIPGFIMTCTLRVHLAAKTVSQAHGLPLRRLANGVGISLTGMGSTIGISSLAFICAGAVPFFSYLIGLHGALCLAPTCLVIPAWMGLYMDWELRRTSWKKRGVCHLYMFTVIVGLFMTVGGTTTTIQSIVDAYEAGSVGTPFSCT